jgi:hypothetical protein
MYLLGCKLSLSTDKQTASSSQELLSCHIRSDANTVNRGIPSGYLSYIEQRLLDTELVVFELLSAIYKSPMPIQPQRLSETERQALADISQKQPKSAKIEEWKSLPLTTDEHRHEWWLKRCESMSIPMQFVPTRISHDAMAAQDAWMDASPLSMQYEDMPSNTIVQSPIPSMSQSESESRANVQTWPSTMNATMPDTNGCFEDSFSTAIRSSLSEQPGEVASDVVSTGFEEPNISNNSQPLNADRWRKYF